MNEETQTELVRQLVSRCVEIDIMLEYNEELQVFEKKHGERNEFHLSGTPWYIAAGFARSMKVLLDAGANPNLHVANFCESEGDGFHMQPCLVSLQFGFSYRGRSSANAIPLLVHYWARIDDAAGGDESVLSNRYGERQYLCCLSLEICKAPAHQLLYMLASLSCRTTIALCPS